MRTFLYSSFLSFFLIISICSYSQDISRYLADGGKSESRNIISFGYDPLNGEFPIKFEHWVVSRFSYEIGGGPVLIDRQNWLLPDEPLPIKQSGLGFSAFIKAKVYFKKFPERFYITLYPKFNFMDHKVFTDAAILNVGYQRIILNRVMLGVESGFGFRIFKDPSWAFEEGDQGITWQPQIPLSLNIGYLF